MIRFTVPGKPKPKQRPRVTIHGTYTPHATLEYEEKIRSFIPQPFEPYEKDVPLAVSITAYQPIPKSWSKARQELAEQGDIFPTSRPDIDNVCKSALDAVNGILFYDDAQVVDLIMRQRYSENPRLEVVITNSK